MKSATTAALMNDQELLDSVVEQTGLSDFGADEFRVGLRVVIASAADADLTDQQRQSLQAGWRANLEKRLRLVELRKRRPEITPK